jgi:hypothetical protein
MTMLDPEQYAKDGLRAGCTPGQMQNFIRGGIILQPRQLAASAAARLCDEPGGPTAIGYGGARGGGKSHWLLAQMGADDCQRHPGLKCLLLRKSGKANRESFDDLRQRLFGHLKHAFSATTGVLLFENGSRIIAKHYQHEKEINESFLGMEYDVIAIEEATTLTVRKWEDIQTCSRTSKPGWRPRIYSTTNPGGVGHDWYRNTFIVPYERHLETKTRFIPARVDDNRFTNPEYEQILASQPGWRKEAWYYGNWNIAAGQFFNTFRHDVHVLNNFDESLGVEWFAGMDYGHSHYTVVLLACLDSDDNLYIVDEHAERLWIPQRHILATRALLERHKIYPPHPQAEALRELAGKRGCSSGIVTLPDGEIVSTFDPRAAFLFRRSSRTLSHLAAGTDLFARQYDGNTVASLFREQGIRIYPANTSRVEGWAAIQNRLGDPDAGIKPSLFIHERCKRLLDCLPYLQHDPDHPADVLKTNTNDEGLGGDDAADALRYLVATRVPRTYTVKLRGL